MKQLERRCGTCRFWGCPVDSLGRRITRGWHNCLKEIPITIPQSARKVLASLRVDFYKTTVQTNGGKECESWEAWK